jgi:hypothetical protein
MIEKWCRDVRPHAIEKRRSGVKPNGAARRTVRERPMTGSRAPVSKRHRVEGPQPPSLLLNWVSLIGAVLAGSSFFAAVCLIALDFFRGFRNPYVGILTYIVAPGFLIAGLLLVTAGALWQRHRRRRLAPGTVRPFPSLDLNVPRQRHAFVLVAGATGVFLLLTAVGSFRTYEFTESVTFCGKTCHSVMRPEYTAYQTSPHARVACVQCHIGPGASWFVKSKISGAYQVYATLVNDYPRPIPAPIRNLRPARETCEQCHWPKAFFGATERTYRHYLPDGGASPWTIQMLVAVGGGDPTFGAVGGIHSHMAIENRIAFIASDREHQVIPWVRLTDRKGKITVYQSTDHPLTADQIGAARPHLMDCIDCHNRAAHIYRAPIDSVNLALRTGRIDSGIPHIKEEAVLALSKDYDTTADAEHGIASALTKFYRSKYPDLARTDAALLARAVEETQRIYRDSVFPDMQVNWEAYPDNVGHRDSLGCFRCHDGNHVSADGGIITHDCSVCHTIIVQGPQGQQETDVAGLEFKHPVDVSEMWRQANCSDCHDGSLVE